MLSCRCRLWGKRAVLLTLLFAGGCTRAPSFDILGSFFPAWLLCFVISIPLTFLGRWILLRLGIPLIFPVLVYPSLAALFTFALWLALFR